MDYDGITLCCHFDVPIYKIKLFANISLIIQLFIMKQNINYFVIQLF